MLHYLYIIFCTVSDYATQEKVKYATTVENLSLNHIYLQRNKAENELTNGFML